MRATVTRDALLRALRPVVPCADPDGNLPILANVRFTVRGGIVELAATDLTATARAEVPATDTADGASTIPAKLTAEIVKSFPAGAIVRVAAEDGRVRLAANWTRASGTPGRCDFTLLSQHAAHFPKLPSLDSLEWGTVDAARFAALLADALRFASTDRSRRECLSVRLESDGRMMRATSTDGHRLARPTAETGGPAFGPIVVHRDGAACILAALTGASHVEIAAGEKYLHARIDGVIVSAQFNETAFPEVEHVRADVSAMRSRVTLDAGMLRAELRLLHRSAQGPRKHAGVTLGWAHGTLRLTVESNAGSTYQRNIPARVRGDVGAVCVAVPYLLDATAGAGDVTIGVDAKDKPVAVLRAGAEAPVILMPRKDGCGPDCIPAPALVSGEAEAPSAAEPLTAVETSLVLEMAEEDSATDGWDPLAVVLGEVPEPTELQLALAPPPAPPLETMPLAPVVPLDRARAKRNALAKRPLVAVDIPAGETWTACDKPGRVIRAGHPFDEEGARVTYYTNRDATLDYVCVRKGGRECWYSVRLAKQYRKGGRS